MTRSIWKSHFIDLNIIRRFDELIAVSFEKFLVQQKLQNEPLTKKFLKQHKLDISFTKCNSIAIYYELIVENA